jgi:hypothetical protein
MKSRFTFILPLAVLLLLTPMLFTGEEAAGSGDTVAPKAATTGDKTDSTTPAAKSGEKSGEQIKWKVLSAGSAHATSSNHEMFATAAQTAVGTITSRGYTIVQGYWTAVPGGGPPFVCGDADGNTIVNISDAVYLIAYIFGGGSAPDPLLSGDADCNQIVNISDAVYLIAYIFGGGPAPCENC